MNKDLSGYISELLYEHDCVIVPAFGGFIANYRPSRIDPFSHSFYPPSKSISFNTNLTVNDGLLANHIARAENIPYDKSIAIIEDFVKEIRYKLTRRNEKIILQNIGVLSFNDEKKMQFEPDETVNYLLDSFGLTNISSMPVKRMAHKQSQRLEQKPAVQQSVQPPAEIKEARKPKISKSVRNTVLVSLPVIALIVFGFLKPAIVKNVYTSCAVNCSSLIEKAHTLIKTDKAIKKETASVPVVKTIEKSQTPEATEQKTETSEQDSTNTTEVQVKYYIIAGSFQSEENANKLIRQLKKKGYEAQIAGKSGSGFLRVSYYSFDNEAKARQELEDIRSRVNTSAWLFKTNI